VESVVSLVLLSLLQAINPRERKVIRLKISFFIIKVLFQPYYLQKWDLMNGEAGLSVH
jgi:hypothetical protein